MVAVGRGLQRYEGAPLQDVTRESEYALGPDLTLKTFMRSLVSLTASTHCVNL